MSRIDDEYAIAGFCLSTSSAPDRATLRRRLRPDGLRVAKARAVYLWTTTRPGPFDITAVAEATGVPRTSLLAMERGAPLLPPVAELDRLTGTF